MHLNYLARRFEKLKRDGLECRIAPGASLATIAATEMRLDVGFPEQVHWFYGTCDGIEVSEPALRLYSLAELNRDGKLVEFCVCDFIHRLAFDTGQVNEAGQWSIVNAETGYRITYTMASFWTIHLWAWIEKGRPIWYDFHGNEAAE